MTEVSEDTQPAMTYPSKDQYARWKSRANKLGMSVSEFIQSMVEAGMKVDQGFEQSTDHSDSVSDLRQQRNDLKSELQHARHRVEKLEQQLHNSERRTIENFISSNPGATHAEIIQHVADTIPTRVVQHLETLEGDSIIIDDGEYYPSEELEAKSNS